MTEYLAPGAMSIRRAYLICLPQYEILRLGSVILSPPGAYWSQYLAKVVETTIQENADDVEEGRRLGWFIAVLLLLPLVLNRGRGHQSDPWEKPLLHPIVSV